VTCHAAAVEHRLNLALEAESARRPEPRLDLGRRTFMVASVRRLGTESFGLSWHPTQERISPGIAVNQLRMSCSDSPFSLIGCTASGVFAGTVKSADPSSSTGTVPRMRLTSHPPSSATCWWPPILL
jgi:hypothetical protein